MNWLLVFNPFSIFSEKQLGFSGIGLTIIGSLLGYWSQVSFAGALDMHVIKGQQTGNVFIENAINIGCMTACLFILGKLFNKKTRLIDILNASVWYRFPIYIISFAGAFLTSDNKIKDSIVEKVSKSQESLSSIEFLLSITFGISLLLMLAYAIVLLVNGFRIATNTKQWQHWVAFGFVILVVEGISQYLIKQLT